MEDGEPPHARARARRTLLPVRALCVAVGYTFPQDKLVAVTSAEPTGGASTWHRVTTADTVGLGVPVSCPTTSLCVAIDGAGRVATSTAPGAATPVWNVAAPISGSLPVNALSCPSVSLCVAVDNSGNVLTSNNPTGGPATWTTAAVHPGGQPVDVSCASNRSLNADARKRRREGFWQAERTAMRRRISRRGHRRVECLLSGS